MIVLCPHCKEKVDVAGSAPNTKTACPKCGGELMTPDIPAAAPLKAPQTPQATPMPQGPPRTNGMAIASLVLAIIGFLTSILGIGIIFGVVALILGIIALGQIKANSRQQKGRGMAMAGVILGALSVVMMVLGILAAIAIPNFISLRSRAYDASARSAGRNAKLAQEVRASAYEGNAPPPYTDDLSELLKIDKQLTDDTDVTFVFGTCNASGYTLTTVHNRGGEPSVYTDK